MKIPNDVKYIIDTLNNNNFEAFIVGGCVRDCLMGITPKDWDITTSALPEQVKKLFKKTFDTGIKHGTITVVINKIGYEVTTYRIDGEYFDGRHPENVFYTSNLEEDLLRRDFTINAIAYNEDIGYVDPFNGINHIKNKIIRGVGEPSKRFQEDALRMFRAVRFSAQLDFNIENKTYEALINNSQLICQVSIERIRDEFIKLIMTDNAQKVDILLESGLIKNINYTSEGFSKNEWENYIIKYFENNFEKVVPYVLSCNKNVSNRLSLLFVDLRKDLLQRFLKFFRLDNKTIKEIGMFVSAINMDFEDSYYSIRKYLNTFEKDYFLNILYLKNVINNVNHDSKAVEYIDNIKSKVLEILDNNDCYKISSLKINGEKLKVLGVTEGKKIGGTLNYLLDEVMKEPYKNDEKILEEIVASKY